MNLQAEILTKLNKREELKSLLRRTNRVKKSATISHKLAHLFTNEDLELALEYAKQAVELSPTNPIYNDTYGWLLFKQQNYMSALEYLRVAQASDSKNPIINYHLAETLAALHRIAEAKDLLQQVLAAETTKIKGQAQALYHKLEVL